MLRLGSETEKMKNMTNDEIFMFRLNLLVLMSRAYLRGFPLGDHRSEAVLENAKYIAREIIDWTGGEYNNFRSYNEMKGDKSLNHIFYQRVRLLTVMATGFATGTPMGQFRRKALMENIEYITQKLTFPDNIDMMESLLVA